jgi:DNA-binding transcriptional MocR family regulator
MKLAADPSIISFAGGMPSNGLFPTDTVDELYASLPLAVKQAGFQYGPTAGYPPLLDAFREYLRPRGLPVDDCGLMITTGGQQALNLVTEVLVDPGDAIITEYPSFIGAIATFNAHRADLHDIPMDDGGILLEPLAAKLESIPAERLKLVYLNPCFHNPAGILYTNERKRQVLELLGKHDVCLLEDDPYSELFFDDDDRQDTAAMASMVAQRAAMPSTAEAVPMAARAAGSVPVCYVGTLAKTLGPGMRIGWILAPHEIIEKCELAKQSLDACTSTFTQVLAHAYISQGKLPAYVEKVRPIYARRARLMLDALDAHMPEGVSWTTPRGGFYVWVTLPEAIDASDVFEACLERGAAFVIGSAFDPQGTRNNTIRLAFSHTPEEKIAEGTRIVCEAVAKLMSS